MTHGAVILVFRAVAEGPHGAHLATICASPPVTTQPADRGHVSLARNAQHIFLLSGTVSNVL